jgi:hypothetical protein
MIVSVVVARENCDHHEQVISPLQDVVLEAKTLLTFWPEIGCSTARIASICL